MSPAQTYLELVRALPRPTTEQCAAFARGMSGRHSWYKHLPLFPTVPFRFFLAPLAPQTSEYGSRLVDRRTVHVRSAADHEATYGYWDCIAPYEMGRGLDADHRAEVEVATGFWVRSADGEKVTVPDDVIAAGTARVDAFVDPRAAGLNAWMWWKPEHSPLEYLREHGVTTPAVLDHADCERVWAPFATREFRERARADQLAGMVAAMTRVIDLVWPS